MYHQNHLCHLFTHPVGGPNWYIIKITNKLFSRKRGFSIPIISHRYRSIEIEFFRNFLTLNIFSIIYHIISFNILSPKRPNMVSLAMRLLWGLPAGAVYYVTICFQLKTQKFHKRKVPPIPLIIFDDERYKHFQVFRPRFF